MNPLKLTFLSVAVVLCLTACEDPGKYLDPKENKSVDLGNGWRLLNGEALTVADKNHGKLYDKDFKLVDIDIHGYEYNGENYTFTYECPTNEFGFVVNLPYRDRKAFGGIADNLVMLMSKKNKALHSKGIPLLVHTKNAGDEEVSPSNLLAVASMEEMIQKGISLNVSIDEENFLNSNSAATLYQLPDILGKIDDYTYYISYLENNDWKVLWEATKEQDEELKKLKLYLDKLDSYKEKLKKRPCDSFWCASGDDALSDKEQFELATQILTETEQWSIDVDNAGMYYSIDINKEPFYGLGLMESLVE